VILRPCFISFFYISNREKIKEKIRNMGFIGALCSEECFQFCLICRIKTKCMFMF
jgi:hypothetical protein